MAGMKKSYKSIEKLKSKPQDTSSHVYWNDLNQDEKIINATKVVYKRECLCAVDGNVNQYRYFGKCHGGSFRITQ